MPTIILSYRREDTAWIAGRIHDRLRDHYGAENVFMDIDSIPFGLDFREHIHSSLERCDILLAIVGPRWVAPNEPDQPRIFDEADWVRIEIEAALAKKIPVIPVLIDGARMPPAAGLPDGVRDIVFRQAADVNAGRDFHPHMDRLIGVMDQLLARQNKAPVEPDPIAERKEERPAPLAKEKPTKAKQKPAKQKPVKETPAEPQALRAASVSASSEAEALKPSWWRKAWHVLTFPEGRLRRGLFALGLVASFVLMHLLTVAVGIPWNWLTGYDGMPPIVLVFPLFWIWVVIALGGKRLHDFDWKAWPVVIPLLLGAVLPGFLGWATKLELFVLFGSSTVVVFLLLSPLGWMRGTEGPNRYGPDPLGPASTDAIS